MKKVDSGISRVEAYGGVSQVVSENAPERAG